MDWINARERFLAPRRLEPQIDIPITRIVGHKIFQHDPRLLKLIVKWKGNKPQDSKEPDNFLQNPKFIEELKKTLSVPL